MKKRQTSPKRIRTRSSLRKAAQSKDPTHDFKSTTMQIPLDAVFDDVQVENITRVEVAIPGRAPSTVPLDKHETLIGRGKECRLCLDLNNVSRIHARIVRNTEEFVIEDLESTNGTFVNNVRVMRCILHDHDQIRIGAAKIIFFRQKSVVAQ